MRRPRSDRARQRGFTLIEMIVSITLVSLLAMVAAPLLRLPLTAWLDASRRAQLTDAIDTVNAKLADDLRRALPNSVRVVPVGIGGRVLLEMLEVRASGRHRNGAPVASQVCPVTACPSADRDSLQTTVCNETCFTSLGPLEGDPLDTAVPGDWVVVNPFGPNGPYFGGNVAVANGIKSRLTRNDPAGLDRQLSIAAHNFPGVANDHRFYVVSTPVTWDCDPATQRLTRRWGYPISAVQPTVFNGANAALLATTVAPAAGLPSSCAIRYTPAGSAGRGGVVQVVVRMSVAVAGAGAGVFETADLVASYPVSEGP